MPKTKNSKQTLYFTVLGCSLLAMGFGQWLLSLGRNFIDGQQPIDWAHWLLLVGAVGVAISAIKLSTGGLGRIAGILVAVGAIAFVGMAAIDILLWTIPGSTVVDTAIDEALDSPGLAIPFLWVGPSLLFIGLALKAIEWLRLSKLGAALLFLGTVMCGYGQGVGTRSIVVIGFIVMLIGIACVYRSQNSMLSIKN